MNLDKLLSRLKKHPIPTEEFYSSLSSCPTTYENPELELELMISNGFPTEIIDDKVILKTTQTTISNQQFCFVDLETIGHNANDGQIIEIGAIKYKNGEIIDTFDRLVYASSVSDTVSNVTGITTAMLEDKPRLRDILEELKIFIEDDIFVAHNVKFDYDFISKSLEKYHLGKLENRKLCTIDLAKKVYQTKRYGLASLTRALQIQTKKLHRAIEDANASLEVFKMCLDNLPSYIDTNNSAEELIDFSKNPLKNQKENPRIILPEIKRIHFIGIGGIGLSALARKLHSDNHIISGSDMKHTILIDKLIEEGIKVNTPHDEKNVSSKHDMIIYSAVIKDSNVEMQRAFEKSVPTYSRNEALKFLLQDSINYNVCGAHGKSTTTAMLSAIMNEASAIIGAESKEFGSNARIMKNSDTIVFEADESDGSFLNSNPYCAIVTNAEPEHMEYYEYDESRFYNSYKEFLQNAHKRVINAEDEHINKIDDIDSIKSMKLYPSKDIKNISYFLKNDQPYTRFELLELGYFDVWGFGEHIAMDASLAILASLDLLEVDIIKSNLLNYKGIKKRFDVLSSSDSFILIDDYAHHPTEIKVSLESLELYKNLKFPNMQIDKDTKSNTNIKKIAIWQPHKYSRTLDNLQAFIECFGDGSNGIDELVILPVWSAGEEHIDIDFASLFARYNPIFCDKINSKSNQIELIKDDKVFKSYEEGMIIGFGAGDITYQLR
jgi:UDP-N-acetylmuramate--alanine ligase